MGSTDTEINWTKDQRHQPTSSEQTLAQRREHPYICVTWLPRLLTGENSCEWAVWFKAHHQDWTRTPSEFNQAEWMLNRTSLLNEQKTQWEARGQDVYVEGQNSFRLQGQSAALAGRPDLIVVRNDDALIIDIEAGQKQPSHYVQIMIYIYALPRQLRKLDNFDFLLLDDLGYLPQGAEESEVLFTLIAERYERRSLGITSNLVFSEWERIFANPMATAAAIDRVVHHSVILEFDVPSYRTNAAQQRGQAKEVNRQN